MLKLKPFQNYFTIFYIFGLNSFVSFDKSSEKRSIIFSYFPRIIYIFIHLIITYEFFKHLLTSEYMSFKFITIILVCSSYIAVFENIFNANALWVILKTVHLTIINLETSLQIQYPFKTLKKNFRRKAFFMFMIIFVGLFIKIFIEDTIGLNKISSILLTLSFFFKHIHLFHFIFYIDFMRFTCESLSQKIVMLKSDNHSFLNEINDSIYVMHQIKLVYYKLWHISNRINSLFGWFSVAYLIESIFIITHSLYWVFLLATLSPEHHFKILRKYYSF